MGIARSRTGIFDSLSPALIGGIGDDLSQEWEQRARCLQQRQAAIVVLHRGRSDICVQQEAERVDDDVALPALDLLASIRFMLRGLA